MNVLQRRPRAGGMLLIGLACVTVACAEDLETTAGCPALCVQNVPVRDTIVSPFSLDTTISGYPLLGSETEMLLASRGDTVETRVIMRFDTLVTTWVPPNDTLQPIAVLDSAYVRVLFDPLGALRQGTLTLEVYDVDTAATDTAAVTFAPLFRPDRLMGSLTLPGEQFVDSVYMPLDTAILMAKLRAQTRLRLGLRLTGTQSAQLRVRSQEGGGGATVRYRPPGDTAVKIISIGLRNKTPAIDERAQSELADFIVVVRGTPPLAAGEIGVGGLPARRAYLRFGLPPGIIDSTNVIRASLLLTQTPSRAFAADDTLTIQVHLSTAGTAVTDVAKSLVLTAPVFAFRQQFAPLAFATDSLRVAASDSGTVTLDLAGLFQFWRANGPDGMQRAIVLRIKGESSLPAEFRFFSSEASASVRPSLRITYVPGRVVGLP